jgi:transposase-like protein
MAYPTTLVAAIRHFSDEQVCIDAVAEMRWPDGKVYCTGCGEIGNTIWLAVQKRWKCRGCKKQFSVKVGTIFHDSPLSLDKWLVAMWMLANCKNGVSSYEIARTIGITQKSAWHMMHRIRTAMEDVSGEKLGGSGKPPVEIDETFVGGKMKNMHRSKRVKGLNYNAGNGKAIVLGMLERGGKVRAGVIADRKKAQMAPPIHATVEAGANIMTDEHVTYPFVAQPYVHEVINHVEGYVRDHVHTNGIENFWSCLKRGLGGTYIAVEPIHLDRYVSEQVFRFNNRHAKGGDASRFKAVLKDIVGRRLTYAELTGRTV